MTDLEFQRLYERFSGNTEVGFRVSFGYMC